MGQPAEPGDRPRNYSERKTSEDGRFLLPNGVFLSPVKESSVDTVAELFSHWENFTSLTSRSINVQAGLHLSSISATASFSHDYKTMKSTQVREKSITTRAQLRFARYTARLQPGADLHPDIRKQLLEVGHHIQNNDTDLARYLSQLVVRDYGTHVIKGTKAGAILTKEDYLKSSFLSKSDSSKTSILISAGADFFGLIGFKSKFSDQASEKDQKTYTSNTISSKVRAIGGPVYDPNTNVSDWLKDLENNLIAIDRWGDPLHYVITHETLPELPPSTVLLVASMIRESAELYYKFNTYPGCTSTDSPRFSYEANVDDGSCDAAPSNFSFGGVYQKCQMDTAHNTENICSSLTQLNPLTGSHGCPAGYDPVLLVSGTLSRTSARRRCKQICYKSGWFSKRCYDRCYKINYVSRALYESYWCVSTGRVSSNSGFMFGGLYSTTHENPVTKNHECPPAFTPLRVGAYLHICVSADVEMGFCYSLPLAGFFSCSAGNPLASNSTKAGSWPKACPSGFSVHMAVIDSGCEINYCVKSYALSDQRLPRIKRPPFISRPCSNPDRMETVGVVDETGVLWVAGNGSADGGATVWEEVDADFPVAVKEESSSDRHAELSVATVVAVSVVCSVLGTTAMIAVIWAVLKRSAARNERRSYEALPPAE